MEGIKVENASYSYDNGYIAVDNVSLEIKKGENLAIIGQNGAGKTTLVKMFNGLLRPQKGKIYVDNEDVSNLTVAQISRKVGYVFQNPGEQIFNPTVYDEIAYTPRYFKLKEKEVAQKVQDAAELCNIIDYLKLNPYDLPFSLRKFVTIASVIAMGTDHIILDEPTAGQDLFGLEQQKKIIKELLNRGKTVITITHDMEFVAENFSRVIVMTDKKIVADKNKRAVFWDFEILKKSSIKQLYVSMLAKELAMKNNVISIDEFIHEVTKK